MGNAIPTKSREQVKDRDDGQCVRCGVSGSEWSHRRPRAVSGGHFQHCPCNGLWLCSTCHQWCHAHPVQARETGFFVSSHEDAPYAIPVKTFYGWHTFDCDGSFHHHTQENQP